MVKGQIAVDSVRNPLSHLRSLPRFFYDDPRDFRTTQKRALEHSEQNTESSPTQLAQRLQRH